MDEKMLYDDPAGRGSGSLFTTSPRLYDPSTVDANAAAEQVTAVYVPLPDGFDDMLPGPELGRILDGLVRGSLNGYQLTVVLRARQRQMCWMQAQQLADVQELGHVVPGSAFGPPERGIYQGGRLPEELTMALRCTPYAASALAALASQTMATRPAVYTGMLEGRLDQRKATVIVEEVASLGDDHAAKVLNDVLPDANLRTTPRVREQIRKLALKLDPDAAVKERKKRVERRDVSMQTHHDGTSTIVGHGLPTERAAAAMDFIRATATATKKAGDPNGVEGEGTRTTSQIRADVFCDLLAGVDPTIPAAEGGAGTVNPGPRKGSVHLRIELETLLGRNDHPGELAGYGPIGAEVARQIADRMHNATWHYSLRDMDRLLHEGRLKYRPNAEQKSFVIARDETCTFPGCHRPASQSELDHIIAWIHNGITHEDNLTVLCRRHHAAKHDGFRLMRTEFGLVWLSPHGQTWPVSFGHDLTVEQRKLLQYLANNDRLIDKYTGPPETTSDEQ